MAVSEMGGLQKLPHREGEGGIEGGAVTVAFGVGKSPVDIEDDGC